MAATVDAAVGSVYDALVDELGEERLTLMVLAGDNGGVLGPGGGSNYPLRGAKVSLWEGGVRNHALLWGSMLPPAARGKVYTGGLIHHVDMHATLAALAGVPAETSLDGLDVWPALSSLGASPRTSLLHNFDPCVFEPHNHTDGLQDCPAATFAYRLGEWKLVVGQVDASRQIGPNPGAASLLLGAEPEPAQESEEVFSSDFNLYGSFLFQLPSSSLESVLLGSHVRLLPEGAIWTTKPGTLTASSTAPSTSTASPRTPTSSRISPRRAPTSCRRLQTRPIAPSLASTGALATCRFPQATRAWASPRVCRTTRTRCPSAARTTCGTHGCSRTCISFGTVQLYVRPYSELRRTVTCGGEYNT